MRRRSCLVMLTAVLPIIACSSFGEDEGQSPPTSNPTPTDDPKKDAPPPPVDTPPPSELTEQFGHFVAEKGNDESGDGSRAKPFKTIGKGLEKAKVDGKRVYVCAGKYIEALTLEDGVSMIGGYDCSQPEWSNSAKKSRVESPTSPAIRAKDIKTLTRFENFDVLAPDAVDPSGSSIGLIAEGSDKLTIVSSRIAAGSGAAGKAGVEGVQLILAPGADGAMGYAEIEYCGLATCPLPVGTPNARPGIAGGVSVCQGAQGHNGGSGGRGGSGGMYKSTESQVIPGQYYWVAVAPFSVGEVKTGSEGGRGKSAGPTPAIGQFGEGYSPANGLPGADGTPGEGGSGGDGIGPPSGTTANAQANEYWHARAGGSGGAGGCPGLAGTPGAGGGASIAALISASAMTFDRTQLEAASGGAGGRGSFGSRPTLGGDGGPGPGAAGKPGGPGGESGVSGSGAGGPSIAVVHSGAAPKLVGTTLKPGLGGKGCQEETSADGKVLPASPNGESKEMLSL